MITPDKPRRLPAFLAPAVRTALIDLASEVREGWEGGRQGTGYDKLDLRALDPAPTYMAALLADARVAMAVEYTGWDAYLLRYRDGSLIPPHRDPTHRGRHLRLNAQVLVSAPGTGELRLDGEVFDLEVGDAVVFRSDQILHQVSPVVGERLVFSVGCAF
jgi:alkylated DNA repair dioxygenase AlkB